MGIKFGDWGPKNVGRFKFCSSVRDCNMYTLYASIKYWRIFNLAVGR